MKRILLLLLSVLMLMSFPSCKKEEEGESETTYAPSEDIEPMDISSLEISEYVKLGQYGGLEISYSPSEETRGEAVWKRVAEKSEILKYPEQQVKYYFNQLKAKYEYIAKNRNDTYANILLMLETDEEEMMAEAKSLTADDLVFYALLDAENIELTDTDKENNFDRYVSKFVTDYGYGEEYVRSNMSDEIYETMLYDKTLEKLISLNEFINAEA